MPKANGDRWTSLVVLLLMIGWLACGAGSGNEETDLAGSTESERIARGEYLVKIMACNDCHTPLRMGPRGPEPDMKRRLSGHPAEMELPSPPPLAGPWMWSGAATNTAFAGPWGVTYSTNLTSDENTGIGIWTEDMFVKAMRSGRHMGTSRIIQPPMPWRWYAHATDADLKAIFAYLRTVPPIENEVPDYQEPPSEE